MMKLSTDSMSGSDLEFAIGLFRKLDRAYWRCIRPIPGKSCCSHPWRSIRLTRVFVPQLFSTPLILTLLLVGGLLFPIVYFAVYQLAQIQTPDQMGVRKDPISGDKKTQ